MPDLQLINTGTTSGDGTGDPLPIGGAKVNANFQALWLQAFEELPAAIGAGPAPATAIKLGGVTLNTDGSAVVYHRAEMDTLLAAKATGGDVAAETAARIADVNLVRAGGLNNNSLSSVALNTTSDSAKIHVVNLGSDVLASMAGGLAPADFLGQITILSQALAPANTSLNKWYSVMVTGTLSGTNAPLIAVTVGDRLLSNGTTWLLYAAPPMTLLDGSVTTEKLALLAVNRPRLTTSLQSVTAELEENATYIWGVVDSNRVRLLGLRKADGKLNALLAPETAQIVNDLTAGGGRHVLDDYQNVLWAIKDSAGYSLLKIIKSTGEIIGNFTMPEVVTARGTRPSLSARLDTSLTLYGLPKTAVWGQEFLPETSQRLRCRIMGESRQLVIALVGDSWTQSPPRYSGPLAAALISAYGNAGGGWCGFAFISGNPLATNGSVNPAVLSHVATGAGWITTYSTAATPDLGLVESATVGDKLTVSGPASCSAVVLYWVGVTSSSVRYRWNAGSWTTLGTATAGTNSTSLTGVPATAWTLEIEVLSGVPKLSGLDAQSAVPGVRVHKLGSSAQAASSFVSVDATNWQNSMATLAPNLVLVMLGTNDQSAYTAAVFQGYLQTLVTRIRTALPLADIMLVAPCENMLAHPRAMGQYADAMRQLAFLNNTAFLDLQPYFGSLPPNYGSTSGRPWLIADGFHPEPTTGGRAIVDALLRVLTP